MPPAHIVAELTVIVGLDRTVTETVFEFTQPAELVPVTVYIAFAVGLATTVAPVELFKLAEGAQEYVPAPLATRVAELPEQIVALLTVIVGNGLTVMVIELEFILPQLLVFVT